MPLQIPAHIENNAVPILDAIGQESVDVYRFLSQRYAENDPEDDRVFQFLFRSFYRLDNAGLRPEFKRRFFEIMSSAKLDGHMSIKSVVNDLRQITNLKGQESLQFSFATKLAATVDHHTPIYDAEVASILGFRAPYNYKSFDSRLEKYLVFYNDLKQLYAYIIETDQLSEIRARFRMKFSCSVDDVSEQKALDFIFWAAGKLSKV